jgi:3-oxoacyl-(acyl-carrier-protein) synthase/thioesterase domain-containing protein/acyl carrier protein
VDVQTPVRDIDQFDAVFFRMTPTEARLTDPQHRLFLECAYRALENGGYAGCAAGRAIGVFGSTSISTYLLNNILKSRAQEGWDSYQLLLDNDKDFLSSRVSYKFDLRGPAFSIQSACSSSLVAVHLACQSIIAGECEMALAGGVSLSIPQDGGHVSKPGGILSNQPSCRAFDAFAAGTVKGNGCGVILLKALDDAEADADQIIAVIRSTAINNDGSEKANFMAPTMHGQASVIREALDVAGIDIEELDYVETHGTGTKLGDMVEVEALTAALSGRNEHVVWLGTLKPNIGHLDVAAGIAGVIKTSLVLNHQAIPGAASFDTPNPDLGLDAKRFCIANSPTPQMRPLRYAGVSSFGIGGTNAFIVMAPPPRRQLSASYRPELILLSAQSEAALNNLVNRLAVAIEKANWCLASIAYTLACRRSFWSHRCAIVASDISDLLSQLRKTARLSTQSNQELHNSLAALGTRWCGGENIDFAPMFAGRSIACVPLPGYGFDRTSYWIDPESAELARDESISNTRSQFTSSADALAVIMRLMANYLGTDEIRSDVDFADQGVDSIMLVDLLFDLEKRFDVVIPVATAANLRTPAALAKDLNNRLMEIKASQTAVSAETESVETHPSNKIDGTRAKLICIVRSKSNRSVVLVHPAGGTISTFVELCDPVKAGCSIYGIPFPKSFTIEPGALPLAELARRYVDAVEEATGIDSLVLGGYSFGGNVAYEMSHILAERYGRSPNLVLFDSHPPDAYPSTTVSDEKLVETFGLVIHSALSSSKDLACATEDIARLYRGIALEAAVERLLRDASLPVGLRADDLIRFYRIWVSNHFMLRGATLRDQIPANLLLFKAQEPECPLILQNLGLVAPAHQSWERYITGDLRIEYLPGDHYTAFTNPENISIVSRKFHEQMSDEWLWRPLAAGSHMEHAS